MPTVSVLIPTFNGADFVAECLARVLEQSYRDLEILVVDDRSTDSTVRIARDFARRDDRIRVVGNDANLGLVGNWTRCIEFARGEWIKFVFQDDLIEVACIEELLREGERSECPFVFCQREYVFADGTPQSLQQFYAEHARMTQERFRSRGWVAPERVAWMILAAPNLESNFIGEPIAVLFKKALVQRFGGFNPLLAVSCDSEFWQRVGVNVGVAHVPEALATFRVHRRATTSSHLRENEFRMNVLDPVVVLHEQAFHPAFEPLRRAAREHGKDLEAMFRKRAAWAFASARHLASDSGGSSPTSLSEWHGVARRLPRLAEIEAATRGRRKYAFHAISKLKHW